MKTLDNHTTNYVNDESFDLRRIFREVYVVYKSTLEMDKCNTKC